MSARMEAMRDLLASAALDYPWKHKDAYRDKLAAALAEVEETEAWLDRLRTSVDIFSQDLEAAEAERDEALRDVDDIRAAYVDARLAQDAAEAERDEARQDAYVAAQSAMKTEAERDRLRAVLAQALDCKGQWNGTVSDSGGYPAICPMCANSARAALGGPS